jgi:lysozyme
MAKNKQTKHQNKRKRKHYRMVFALAVVCAVMVTLQSNRARRGVIKTYNRLSVYLEKAYTDRSAHAKHFDVKIPRGYQVHGIDVSRYQHKINWEEVARFREDTLRIDFAFIKATEGKTLSDRYYNYNMENARKHNIICGAYHYYKPHVNSKQQALNFISLVTLTAGDLPPVLDIEEESPYGADNMCKGIKNWLEIVEEHYGMKPVIYTSNSFHRDYLSGKEFEDYPFWIAHHHKATIKTASNWIFWQHSDKARVSGINGYVDINVYNGDLTGLKKLCKKE